MRVLLALADLGSAAVIKDFHVCQDRSCPGRRILAFNRYVKNRLSPPPAYLSPPAYTRSILYVVVIGYSARARARAVVWSVGVHRGRCSDSVNIMSDVVEYLSFLP